MGDISGRCRQPRSSDGRSLFGLVRRSNRDAKLVSLLLFLPFDQSADHSSVPAKFRTAVPQISGRGGRQRFALDGRSGHHGRLANPQVDARPIGPYTAVKQPVRAPCPRDQIAMIEIVLHRSLSQDIASSDVRQEEQGDISLGWQGKSAAFGRAHVVGGVEV